MSTRCNTIVLIHDLWLTPLSWHPFHKFYGNLGYQVLAPAWPGLAGSIADLRRDSSALHSIGLGEIAARYAKIILHLSEAPILIGHGYGGVVTQLLVDQQLGAAGVAIASAPPKGILFRPRATGLTLLPLLANLCTQRGTVGLTFTQFRWRFGNTLPTSEARRVYETQIIPAPLRPIFQVALANVTPHAATTVDFNNPQRPPLLFIAGSEDLIAPPSLVRKTFRKHRGSPRLADYKEFPGRGHTLIAEQGWQEVADYALNWALAHARPLARTRSHPGN